VLEGRYGIGDPTSAALLAEPEGTGGGRTTARRRRTINVKG